MAVHLRADFPSIAFLRLPKLNNFFIKGGNI